MKDIEGGVKVERKITASCFEGTAVLAPRIPKVNLDGKRNL